MEDPSPSSAAPDPSPSPPPHPQSPEEEGDGWVLVPASEVEGAHAPKVIHWDDLQQELARLWSLSAALQPAGDRKAHLEFALQVIVCRFRWRAHCSRFPAKLLGSPVVPSVIRCSTDLGASLVDHQLERSNSFSQPLKRKTCTPKSED